MIWIILGIVLGFSYGLMSDDGDAFLGCIIGLVGGLLGAGFALLLGFTLMNDPKPEHEYTQTLSVLQDGKAGGGSYFLLAGTYQDDAVYRWYTKDDDDFYHLKQTYASYAQVKETADNPHVVVQTWRSVGWFRIGMWARHTYDFYVPHGTVKQDYALDAK